MVNTLARLATFTALLSGAASHAFQVNTNTTDDQVTTGVAVDDSGNFAVVWQSLGEDGDGWGIFAQRYESNGAPAGAAFQVNDQSAGDQVDAAVSVAPGGEFVVTWSTMASSVVARRFDSLGVPAGTAFQVAGNVGLHQFPAVDHDGGGNFTIVWSADDGDSTGVFARRYDSAGAALGSAFQVNTYTTGQQSAHQAPAIAAAPDGTLTIVWHSQAQDDGDIGVVGGGVYGQRYDSTGAPIGTEFQINVATAGGQGAHGVDVAADALGNFVVAWSDNNEGPPFIIPGGNIAARRFDNSGAPLGGDIAVNSVADGRQYYPSIAMDGAGNFMITFKGSDGGDGGVRARNFTSDGSAVGNDFLINTQFDGEQWEGGADAGASGPFVAGWSGFDADGMGAFARRFATTPPTCAAAPAVPCRAAGKSRLALKASGTGKVTWSWGRGDGFDKDQLGNPEGGLTDYAFCLYRDNGVPELVFEAFVEAAGTCGNRPCWKAWDVRPFFTFKNGDETELQGITSLLLRGGADNRSKLKFAGRGSLLNLPALPLGPFATVTAQLINSNGECWQSEYDTAITDTSTFFKAK